MRVGGHAGRCPGGAKEGLGRRKVARVTEPHIDQVPVPIDRPAVAQQIEEGKDDLGGSGRIRGMFPNRQLVYPRTVYTDLNSLRLMREWHEVKL